eukprot:CAMPEP_0204589628 /NCGR_PEP_ID=MMETSP0661-20131031/49311_1 /ASSEMBLY_ACC=CAM_ASM_000606 /TAXON_ID=109239 /ORGANISM="Alexandrium margalefi, Strain AMGDE01CS-322" /LENGTH=99 /DNA_ID=CAMNT_0051599559 /DNA_START=10 /DNA_END=307 /DNA_ORIENTATION=+
MIIVILLVTISGSASPSVAAEAVMLLLHLARPPGNISGRAESARSGDAGLPAGLVGQTPAVLAMAGHRGHTPLAFCHAATCQLPLAAHDLRCVTGDDLR